ncbi:MAG: glycosyltransferase, partial [Candidatus Omnitrophica bacterium]|nr:glycosyltransferase [Candidatus Omnitrophota bacterium]
MNQKPCEKKLRILQLIPHLEGMSGSIRTLLILTEELVHKGHKVVIAHPQGDTGTVKEKFAGLNVEIVNLGWGTFNLTRWQRIVLLVKIVALIRREKISVIHAHHFDVDWFAALAGALTGCRVVVTIHARSYLYWVQRLANRYRLLVFPFVHAFVNVSGYMQRQFLAALPGLERKTFIVHNGVGREFLIPVDPEQRKTIRQNHGVNEPDVLIGFVGNYHEVKGFDYFLQALPLIKDRSYRVMVIGADYGPEMERFDRFLRGNDLGERVIFAGFCQNIAALLDAIDIFVCSSTEESDSWVVSEAMAKGKAVVVSAIGGIPEKIDDGETGLLVPARDSTGLAEKISFLIANPERCRRIGRQAREYIKTRYSFETMGNEYERLYRQNKVVFVGYHNPNFRTITEYTETAIIKNGYALIIYDDRHFFIPGRIRDRIYFLHYLNLKLINKYLVALVKKHKPEICLVSGGTRIFPRTIARIKELGTRTALWTIDVPVNFAPIALAAPYYDECFCGGSEALDLLRSQNIKNLHWLPFACDPERHYPVTLRNEERRHYHNEIVFVGSYYRNRAEVLEKICDFDLGVWGPGWDKVSDDSPLKKCVRKSGNINEAEWLKIIASAKIVVMVH